MANYAIHCRNLTLRLGGQSFLFFRLGQMNDGLKVDSPLVDHEKINLMVNYPILAHLPAIN